MSKADVGTRALPGWWRVLSFQIEFEDTGECTTPYGTEPLGHMVIEHGRIMSMLTARERLNSDPARLFETMIAYAGLYHVENEDTLIITVDTAWHPAWIGTEQVRYFKVNGDTLSLTTAWQTHPSFAQRMARGVLTAQREHTRHPLAQNPEHGEIA